jgi:hypothetical protein
MEQVGLKLTGQYGVQNIFYIKSLIYYDYDLFNLKAHKYSKFLLTWK